jgi:integrase
MDKITTRQIQAFIHNLAEPGINKNTGGGLSPKTQGHYLTFISSVFEYAGRMDMIKDNPARRVKIQKAEPKEKEIYTLKEAQTFLDRMQTEPLEFQAFFALAMFGGFRKAEILGLEWKDIDFNSQIITICRSSLYTKEIGMFTDTTKTKGSQRSLKLPESVMDILRRYRVKQNLRRLQIGDQWENTDRLFTKWNGAPMGSETPYKWLKNFVHKTIYVFLAFIAFGT